MKLKKNKVFRKSHSFVFSSIVMFIFSFIVFWSCKEPVYRGIKFLIIDSYIFLCLGYIFELWQYEIIKKNREIVRNTTNIRRSLFINELPFDTNLEKYFAFERKKLEDIKKDKGTDIETLKNMYSLEKLWEVN